MFKNKLLLNSPPLSDKITTGAQNMAIQYLMKASTIYSFRFERTTATVLKRFALSMISKNLVPLISFKSTETVSLNSLEKEKPTTGFKRGCLVHISQQFLISTISFNNSSPFTLDAVTNLFYLFIYLFLKIFL